MKKVRVVGMMIVLACLCVVTVGCTAIYESIDKKTVAYVVGKVVTVSYLATQENLSAEHRDIVKNAWNVFNENLDKMKDIEVCEIPTLLKEQVRKKVNNNTVADQICELIDVYWLKLDEKVGINSLPKEEAYVVLCSFRNGIIDGLNMVK